uniref:Uncharacterized protein n=1 Tax=Pygocentrus nattereri TaxID=42514 RepID=A0AAR2J367_PYGNA
AVIKIFGLVVLLLEMLCCVFILAQCHFKSPRCVFCLIVISLYEPGVQPNNASSVINALLLHHYKRGAYYPKGGASEIPFHITKVIQKYVGNVLVRAPVTRVLVNSKGAAYGVSIKKGQEEVEVRAPIIISNCGVFNTFKRLLPPEIQAKPEIQKRLDMLKPGRGSLLVFSGFDATAEELGINSTNLWLFKNNDIDAMSVLDEAPEKVPWMFITFPSAKDPTLKIRLPGKTCMTILTMVNYEWFEEWKDATVKKRRDDYMDYKMRFAKHLFDWACMYFPKLREKVKKRLYFNLRNFVASRGATYAAEHNLECFHIDVMAKNCCNTPDKHLFISGQDVFSCGIVGAVHGGLLCASTALGQIVYVNLFLLKKKLKRRKAREMSAVGKEKLQ